MNYKICRIHRIILMTLLWSVPSLFALDDKTINELVIIDGSLTEAFDSIEPAGHIAVMHLESDHGIEQISDALSRYQNLDAIHLVSHGSSGQIILGNEILDLDTLGSYTHELAAWGQALNDQGDLLLYGCSVGAGETGQTFVAALAEVTGANVAASDDATGNAEGTNWELEISAGGRVTSTVIDCTSLEPGTIRLAEYTVNAGDTYTGDLVGTGEMDTITINGTVTGKVDGADGSDWITNNGTISGNIVGGSGEDVIVNNGTVAEIYGTAQSDTITHTGYANKIAGQGGNETIITSGDVGSGGIKAGSGDDTISWYGGTVTGGIDGQSGGGDILNLNIPAGTASYSTSGTASSGTLTYDGKTLAWTAFETLNVIPPSSATTTTAYDDPVTTSEDLDVSFDVLANDTCSGTGGTLTVVSIDKSTLLYPSNLEQITNGTFLYHSLSSAGYIDFDYLAVGETATETFTYSMEDEEGVTSTAMVTITITGLNDDPQFLLQDDSGAMTVDSADPLTATGNWDIHDADTSDTHTVTALYNDDAAWTGGTLTTAQIAILTGGLTVDNDDQEWQYSVANADVQFLTGGQTVVFSYDLTLSDGNGGSETKTVTLTINGPDSSVVVSLDSFDNLVIEDVDGTQANPFKLTSDGSTLTIQDLSGNTIDTGGLGTGDGTDTVTIHFSAWSGGIIVNSSGGDDSLEIDYTGSADFDGRAITFNGGDNSDSLVLTGGSFAEADYSFANENDGSIDLDGIAITYTGLEPISSTITATDVTLNYSETAETITVSDAGSGQTEVASTAGETVTFNNPTGTLTINPGDTNANYLAMTALPHPYPANIVINGGNAGDKVDFFGAITLAADKSLSVDADIIKLWNAAADITTSGTGSITLLATQKIQMISGSSLSTVDGGITLNANSDGTSTGNFKGIDIQTASLLTTGMGAISLTGNGGDTGTYNYGVHLRDSTSVSSTATGAAAGAIILNGTGGHGDAGNQGLALSGSNVTSVDGEIHLSGQGSTVSTGDGNPGIVSDGSSQVIATGSADITAHGTGGGTGSLYNYGVQLLTGGIWQVASGTLNVSGKNSAGNSLGIFLNGGGLLSSGTGRINLMGDGSRDLFILNAASKIGGSSATGNITLNANTIDFSAGEIVTAGSLTIQPRTVGTTMGLGGGSGTLNLDDGEISRLADGFSAITIGNANAGNIDIDTVTFMDSLNLITGGEVHDGSDTDITMVSGDTVTINGTVAPGQSPGILNVVGDVNLPDGITFSVEIDGSDGAGVTGGHDQLNVTGSVNLLGTVTLTLSGSPTLAADESFTIVARNGGSGIFDRLPEGYVFDDFMSTGLHALLTYVGGDGNDVVLTTFVTPEMDVQGKGLSIPDGHSIPSVDQDTDFGEVAVPGSISVSHTFTIINTGNGDLSLTGSPAVMVGGANPSDFSVTVQPASPVTHSGGTSTFTLQFDPTASGLRTATVSIANDDADENPYTFAVQGSGSQCTLTLSSNSGGSVSVPGEGSFSYDYGTTVNVTTTALAHYHFVQWTGTAVDAGKVANINSATTTVSLEGNYSLTAIFAIDTHTLTTSSNTGGSVTTPGEGTYPYNYGTSVDVTASPEAHYHFVEWTGTAVDAGKVANVNSATTTVSLEDDYTLAAVFAIDTHTLTVSSNTGGSVSVPGEGVYPYDYGTVINLTAVPEAHYHFVEWTGTAVDASKVAKVNSATTSVSLEADYTLTAIFAIDVHTLTLSSTAGGDIVNPGEGELNYDFGTQVQLQAQVNDPLFAFSHFEGNLWASYSPYHYRIKGDAQIRAIFQSILDVLIVDANVPEDQYENGTDEYPFNSIQEAIEVAAPGSTIMIRSGTYEENLELSSTSLTLTGVDVNNVNDWAFPVLSGIDDGPVISVKHSIDPNSLLRGLTIIQGNGRQVGGIDCDEAQLTLANCFILGNRCDQIHGKGGALRAYESQVNLINCTVSGNYSGRNGAALLADSNSVVTLSDSILWNNEPTEILYDETSEFLVQYSNVSEGMVGEGNLSMDPLFESPGQWEHALNPGMVVSPTHDSATWITGDYHLTESSPCIDAGDPNALVELEPEPNGDRINMGAYGNTPQASVSLVD